MENDKFTGFYELNGMHVIITNGIGVSLVPIRYRAKGEIVQFRLIKEN